VTSDISDSDTASMADSSDKSVIGSVATHNGVNVVVRRWCRKVRGCEKISELTALYGKTTHKDTTPKSMTIAEDFIIVRSSDLLHVNLLFVGKKC
jgi:hypothetical protein